MNIPIITGRGPNTEAIKIVEDALEKLKKGELLNVAIVAEGVDGQPLLSFNALPSEALKLRGALGLLASVIDQKLMGR